jgi:2-dehydro-3-deoxygluconokinase
LLCQAAPRDAIEFAVAAAVMKHSIPGDFNLVGRDEILASLTDSPVDVRR